MCRIKIYAEELFYGRTIDFTRKGTKFFREHSTYHIIILWTLLDFA